MRTSRVNLSDDSGFLALIDPDAYQGFVDDDWEFEQLMNKFLAEMAAQRLLIWRTGSENDWNVDIGSVAAPSNQFRSIAGTIVATRGRLLLTNFESLSMAAQFDDHDLLKDADADCIITLDVGAYRCDITQLSDPESEDFDEESADTHFVIQLAA